MIKNIFSKMSRNIFNSTSNSEENMFKLFYLFLIFFLISFHSIQSKRVASYYTKFECKLSEDVLSEYVYPNYTCSLKNYAKHLSTFNIYFAVRKPLEQFYVKKDFLC